jgi:stage II sporulation protein D
VSRRRIAALALAIAAATSACTSASPQAPAASARATVAPRAASPTAVAPPAPSGSASTSGASTSPNTSPAPSSLELALPGRGTFEIHALYPRVPSRCVNHHRGSLTARYPGNLTIDRADDGTSSLTVSLAFEDYLRGIAEVPPTWPMAALEAQAIAARSYALASTGWTGEGNTLREPICSTSSCQVYRGLPLSRTPGIGRWYRAVRRTRGEIIVDDGRPATTFYFSTSNGRTYGNEDVFGGSPLPYLRPVTERDDGASPTSHWATTIRYRDLATFLEAAGEWSAGARITGVRFDAGQVAVDGPAGSRTVTLSTFRDAVNAWASCLEPGRYPQGGLPTTIPSAWLSIDGHRRAVSVTGRGWGHGVGMVQWGAYGKARRGWSADRILSFYYGGFTPQPFPEPGLIDVRVATGLERIRVVASRRGVTANGAPLGSRRILVSPLSGPLAEG